MFRRRQWHPTPVLLPRKSHGRRSLVGCSPWGRKGSDTTERLHFHFSLSCIGKGDGNPLQCSCRENPRDGGAWWADVYGVAQSRTRLKRLSSSVYLEGNKIQCMITVRSGVWIYQNLSPATYTSSNSLDSVQAGQGMLSKLNYAGMPLSSSAVSTALLRFERDFFLGSFSYQWFS